MSDFLDRVKDLSPKRLTLLALELHDQLEAAKRAAHEPIAIIGMGCRFPGDADSPEGFWQLLRDGRDCIGEIPRDRWDVDAFYDPDPDVPARISVRSGGFLRTIGDFDAAFFGIAPREALTMDPQQRLLLEVAWEALEHAGVPAAGLAGSQTGVFIGLCNSDHFHRLLHRGDEAIDAYLASGNAASVAAGRISYCLGLQGPALAIDTACSSSLVALHVACRSLRNQEIRMALAGGVNVMCTPETTIALTKGHMLAPDGRCKTFDAAADGFSRGEGCGILVLKRLTDAVADGDNVLAVVRGTAINQDGRSGGLTVPNGPAQEAVIRAALADADASPSDIDYVEAHGTGTSLGDPIEVRALAGALGQGRPADKPLLIGSVKTNFGHLESAAGVAGVMKVVLSLLQERIPQHLHFRNPNPHVAWSDYPVSVTAQARPWPRGPRRRLAGVSSFGFSGTNAHVIVEEAPTTERHHPERAAQCLPISARSDAALSRVAGSVAAALSSDESLADVAYAAGAGRSHLNNRAAVVASDSETAIAALRALEVGEPHHAAHRGTVKPGQRPEVVFLYTGQGAQHPGMSRSLYEASPVFRDVVDECHRLIGTDAQGKTLKQVLFDQPTSTLIHETAWTQPAMFTVECGLTKLWRSWGVEPAAVIGHSVGEYAAACAAGVFSLEDGLQLIAERGRLMQSLPPGGSMAAIFTSAEAVEAAIAQTSAPLAIAAINGPENVVVSGDDRGIDAVLAHFARREVRGQKLFVSFAAHSPLVASALDAMEALARTVTMHAPRIPVAWNVTGGTTLPTGDAPDATYWRRHLRETVRFADGLSSLHQQGYRVYLEVGPHPTLLALARQTLPEADALFLSSLRRERHDWDELLASVAELYVHGAPIDWAAVSHPHRGNGVRLPTYPFERRSYWTSPSQPRAWRSRQTTKNALRGTRLPTAAPVFETILTARSPAYLADHVVKGAVLAAGPVFLEMAQGCAVDAFGIGRRTVFDFEISEPLFLDETGRTVQVSFGATADGYVPFMIHSRAADETGDWQLHAKGKLLECTASSVMTPEALAPSIAALANRLGPPASCDAFYERLSGLGIELGESFRSLTLAHTQAGEALARVECPAGCDRDEVAWAHPSLLDGALHACGLALSGDLSGSDVYLLVGIGRAELEKPLPSTFWCHAHVRPLEGDSVEREADVELRQPDGAMIGKLTGVRLRRASAAALDRAAASTEQRNLDGLFYEVAWEPLPPARRAAAALLGPQECLTPLNARFTELARKHHLAIYDTLLPELDKLSRDYAMAALLRLGFNASKGRRFEAAAELERLRVTRRHERLFQRMLDMLVEDGLLRRHGTEFEICGTITLPQTGSVADGLQKRFAPVDGELRMLVRCGAELERVLVGDQDPLHLLFPGGSFAEAHRLYVESPYARTYNTVLGEALKAAVAALPPGAPLRVLEIGAGTGGTTGCVLPLLAGKQVEYEFTDISRLFLDRAGEQFADYGFVRPRLLDIEQDPLKQGFEVGGYDAVIAANVLHATSDLRRTLRHVRSLMAPGAILYLLEGVERERWVDLTFGLTDGWWRFEDEGLRPDYPLLDREQWGALLKSEGFEPVSTIPAERQTGRGVSQQVLFAARRTLERRTWTILGDGRGVGEALSRLLTARGDLVTRLPADALPGAGSGEHTNFLYLGALELASRAADDATALEACKRLSVEVPLRFLGEFSGQKSPGRAWLVTRGAQPVLQEESPGARWQAPLWGVGRVFALEHKDRWGGLVDLPPGGSAEAAAKDLLASLDADDREDQVAWRGQERFVARLVRGASQGSALARLRADATYLVTGGYGGLGLIVAHWLATRGAKHVALLGRRPDPQSDSIRRIEALGARVIPLAGDIADTAGMEALLEKLDRDAPPVRGVIHAAADLSVGQIGQLSAEQVSAMLRPKIDGTVVIEQLMQGRELDFFVLFSSTTALLGASGFAHYAAANQFLDATAHAARQEEKRVISINWGTWDVMRLASAEAQRTYREAGLEPMRAEEALAALERILTGSGPQKVVARIDWSVLKPLHEARGRRPFLDHMSAQPRIAPRRERASSPSGPSLLARLRETAEDLRDDVLIEFVGGEVASVLGLDRGQAVPPDAGLFELGMDSLMSVELKRRLETASERSLPSTLTFNHPNVAALAAFLRRELDSQLPKAATVASSASAAQPAHKEQDEPELDDLSDAELEARLLARLEKIQ